MRVVFMGTPDYATTIFEGLIGDEAFEVVGLFTQPDKPVGRKKVLTPPHIKAYMLEHKIDVPIFQPTTLKSEQSVEQVRALKPDFIVVAAYGQILPKAILEIAPCINLHASLLPKYRGASPIQQAILARDNYTGVTSMLMDEGLDTGDILGFAYEKIDENTMVDALFYALAQKAKTLTIQTLKRFDTLAPYKQQSALASHSKKIKKSDGEVDFLCAKTLDARYRAYKFWPSIFTHSGLKIVQMEMIESESINRAGEILEVHRDAIVVGCAKGKVRISTVQPQSKKAMRAVDYIHGQRLGVADFIV